VGKPSDEAGLRRTCQVFLAKAIQQGLPAKRCGEPAVDYVEIAAADFASAGDCEEILTTRIWLCAFHWDEYKRQNDKS